MAPTITLSNIYFLFLLYFLCETTIFAQPIPVGSFLFPTVPPTLWFSNSRRFAFGFYPQGDGFKVGIFLFNEDGNTTVWTARRDCPPVSSNAKLVLTKEGGLLLQTGPEKCKAISQHHNNVTVSSASMLDSGTFVLRNETGILWQSFDFPTDTLLGSQTLPGGRDLVSSSSETDQSPGRFKLSMQSDGNLVLYPRYSANTSSDAYWASGSNYGTSFKYYLYLNDTDPSPLWIVNASSPNKKPVLRLGDSNFKGKNSIYRATLNSDGVLGLYAHFENSSQKHQVKKLWSPSWLDNHCNVMALCGFNSYCTLFDYQSSCKCLPGFDFIDPNKTYIGCKRVFSKAECKDGKDNATLYHMFPVFGMIIRDPPYKVEEDFVEEECQSSCLQDCYCAAAFIENNRCRKQHLPFKYVKRNPLDPSCSTVYFKVGNQSLKSNPDTQIQGHLKTTSKKAIVRIVVIIVGFAILLFSAIGISGHSIYKIGVLSYKRLLETGDLGFNEGITLRVFSYNELKKATDGFKKEVGKGSFGSVYRGTLHKGRKLIAVKRLHKLVEEGEREFQAEMQAIGKTHHKNLVRLLGYCAEGSKRLLVYEYMSNGSLDKLIFGGATVRPDWNHRRRIALNIARGLLYLHEQCGAPVIHCDIKPSNILMDEFWTAKISDFGLAKLLMPDQTRTFTQVRGTRGYLAPEWSKSTPITVKADVYSYGVMLLEIVFCRRSLVVNLSNPEQIVLSNWVYKCFVRGELRKLVHGDDVEDRLVENMVKVGLWCIQEEPFLRPSMKSVVLMLEGVTDVAIPPCPSPDSR